MLRWLVWRLSNHRIHQKRICSNRCRILEYALYCLQSDKTTNLNLNSTREQYDRKARIDVTRNLGS